MSMVRSGDTPTLMTLDGAIADAEAVAATVTVLVAREPARDATARCAHAELTTGREQLFHALNAALDARGAIAQAEIDPAGSRGRIDGARLDARRATTSLAAITEDLDAQALQLRRLLDDETLTEV